MSDATPRRAPVLVTGGNGAIGRFVVAELSRRGIPSMVLSRSGSGDARAGVTSVAADIRDLDAVRSVLERHAVHRVIHLAAFLLGCQDDPLHGFEVNTRGVATLLEAVRLTPGTRPRVVFASSKSAFGPLRGPWGYPEYRPVTEDHPRRPELAYGVTKKMAEDVARLYSDQYGVDVVTVRFGTTCGPGKTGGHGATTITSMLIENAVDGKPTVVPQGGDERDDIIFNRDVAFGLVQAALAPRLHHSIYHLGSGRLVTLHDLAAAIREHVPGASITIGPGLDYMGLAMGNYCLMDISRTRQDLGFGEPPTLSEWVGDYVATYKAAKARA